VRSGVVAEGEQLGQVICPSSAPLNPNRRGTGRRFGLDFIPNQERKMNQNQETKAARGHPAVEVTLRRKRRCFTAKKRRRIVKESLRSDYKVAKLCHPD